MKVGHVYTSGKEGGYTCNPQEEIEIIFGELM